MSDTTHEARYTGALYVRPVGRGIVLEDDEARPHVDEWIEQALHDAGVLGDGDGWLGSGRSTPPVTLTIRVTRPDTNLRSTD
jgi:hypothetical protein